MAFQARVLARQLQGSMRPFSSLQNTATTQYLLRPLPQANLRRSPVMMVVRRDFSNQATTTTHTPVPDVVLTKNQYNPHDVDFLRRRIRDTKLYHYTSIGLAVAIPVGVALSPGIWMLPIDTAICTLLAGHAWWGGRSIVEDYVPGQYHGLGKVALALLVLFTYVGLLGVSIGGRGLCESFKSMWRSGPLDDSLLGMRPNLHGIIEGYEGKQH